MLYQTLTSMLLLLLAAPLARGREPAPPRRPATLPAAMPAAVPPRPIQEFRSRGNPVFDGADPHAIVVGGTLWIYPTRGFGRGRRGFWAFASEDLVNWRVYGPVLDYAGIGWIEALDKLPGGRRQAWAPGVAADAGHFYFYYSAGPQDPVPSSVGAAVGDAPWGPFRDIGRPLVTGALGEFEAIDPMVFTDPKDGKHYLYAGGSNPGVMRVWELDDSLVKIVREVPVEQPPQFTEGAFVHAANGRYYLTYSHGGWRDATYSVHAAEADSPAGPWRYRGPILVSDATHKGPGHHSLVNSPHDGRPYIVYHRWNDRAGDGPYDGSRAVAIDALEYDDAGHIRPVKMTDAGVSTAQWFGRAK